MATTDIAFSPSVKAIQARKGSRTAYARVEARGGWRDTITPPLADWLARQTTSYLATASTDGQPYVQHRGGPPGFLKVVDEHTLGWVEYAGNRQFITAGNLADNAKAHLFVMDYEHQERIKFWGTAEVVENDPALIARLMPPDYRAEPEAVILFHVKAWDGNCPQHIPVLVPASKS
ncbi:MAG: pyridoxamine 5'-phosphate oxidase family protein [Kofleriaceae bacterium]